MEKEKNLKRQRLMETLQIVGADYEQIDEQIALELLDEYFQTVIEYMGRLDTEPNSFTEQKLELWLWDDSQEENVINLVNYLYEKYAQKRLQELSGNDRYKNVIREQIVKNKISNRKRFHIRIMGEEYIAAEGQNKVLFTEYGSLTNIKAIRLIEKIKACKRKNSLELTIGCFGDLDDVCELEKFFREQFEIKLHKYKKEEGRKYIFACDGTEINLKDIQVQQKLVKEYDLLLFLDESCFYRRFQSHKSVLEENRSDYVKELWEEARDTDNMIEKMAYYTRIYEEAVRYLSDYTAGMSGEYEFDNWLLQSLENVVNEADDNSCADVYCYIGSGKKIADRNIERLNVCKDEYYNGKNIIVYKVGRKRKLHENVQDVYEKLAVIELWKLIKSINCDLLKEDQVLGDCKVEFWKDWKLLVDVSDNYKYSEDNILHVKYAVCSGKMNNEKKSYVEMLVKSFLNMTFEDQEELRCVTVYLRTLLGGAIMSKANGVEEILIAYLIKAGASIEFDYVENADKMLQNRGLIKEMSYKERKTINTIIEYLNRSLIRNMEEKEKILQYSFKPQYASDISDETFFKYLGEINKACENCGLTSSRIYYYSKPN